MRMVAGLGKELGANRQICKRQVGKRQIGESFKLIRKSKKTINLKD